MKKVTIKLMGGSVVYVDSSPGVEIEVIDYDIENVEEDRLVEDCGRECVISNYKFPEKE